MAESDSEQSSPNSITYENELLGQVDLMQEAADKDDSDHISLSSQPDNESETAYQQAYEHRSTVKSSHRRDYTSDEQTSPQGLQGVAEPDAGQSSDKDNFVTESPSWSKKERKYDGKEHSGPRTPPPADPDDSGLDKLEPGEDHIELDYGEEDDLAITDAQPEHAESRSAAASRKKAQKEEGRAEKSEEEGELSEEEDGAIASDDGEVKEEEDWEDGEIKDGRRTFVRTQVCRFFSRGSCTWGYNCRFIHPGVNDKGNYCLIERGPPPMFHPPPLERPPEMPIDERVASPSPPPPIPKPETAWERGLRQAKEAIKRASRKKEMEIDIEDKKMHLSLNDMENKENERKYRDPYYDSLQYDDLHPAEIAPGYIDELEPVEWEPAMYENFDVHWTQANYDLPFQREWRGEERPFRREPREPRFFDRGPRIRPRTPPYREERRYSRDEMEYRKERPPIPRQAPPSDAWVDPWQRAREKPRSRRRSHSGSSRVSSFSSVSSRSSSASSFSSRSRSRRSRSRTRTPTPLRGAVSRTQRLAAQEKQQNEQGGPAPVDRAARKGPDWMAGSKDRGDLTAVRRPPMDKPSDKLSSRAPADRTTGLDRAAGDRLMRERERVPPPRDKDLPPAAELSRPSRKDQVRSTTGKSERRRGSASGSSLSSSGSSSVSGSSHSGSSSGSSSSGSRSTSSSSSGSSHASSSASDSDDLYSGISKGMGDERRKRSSAKASKERRHEKPVSKPMRTPDLPAVDHSRMQGGNKSGNQQIKLTLVNKSKVQPKKRVMESPPPEALPPPKKPAMEPQSMDTKAKADTSKKPTLTPVKLPPPTSKPSTSTSKPVPSTSKQVAAPVKKVQTNRREELLKQLKAVEEAIAKKRSKT